MYLTCPQCQTTFQMDDQLYAQQGGALCSQCQVPLVPIDSNAYAQSWGQAQGQDVQWGQQNQNAQWGQQNPTDAQWGQQDQNAQWGQMQNPTDAQWGQMQNPTNAQWGQQNPTNAQWGQQNPTNAQWGQVQNPTDAQWGHEQTPWSEQPNGMPADIQWGQASVQPDNPNAQWGQPPQNPSWGQQPAWSQQQDQPKKTIILPEGTNLNQELVKHEDNGERTIALNIDDPAFENSLNDDPQSAPQAAKNGGDDWGAMPDGWNSNNQPAKSPKKSNAGALIIGQPMDPVANESMTHQIDIREVQKMYGDKPNHFAEFFRSIPMRYFIILGSCLGLCIIGFIVGAVKLSRPPEKDKVFDERGDLTDTNVKKELTFADTVANLRSDVSAYSAYPTLEGENIHEGIILTATKSKGIFYNDKKIADVNDLLGDVKVKKITDVLAQDEANENKRIIALLDTDLPMSAIYRILYSIHITGRQYAIGGTTTTGVTSFEFVPCEWPDDGMIAFASCRPTAELHITQTELILKRIKGELPLATLEDGSKIMELRDTVVGDRLDFTNIMPAISRARSGAEEAIIINSDGGIKYGTFLKATMKIIGPRNNPIIKNIYIKQVPLI